jgi:outer membrane lipoprotein SlyB
VGYSFRQDLRSFAVVSTAKAALSHGGVVAFLRVLTLLVWAGCAAYATDASCARPTAVLLPLTVGMPMVSDFELERVEELAVGVPLNFSVYGSPGAMATLSIEGGGRLLDLPETRPGIYEGTYVLDRLDEIRPDSRVVASLQRGGQVARLTLAEPLLLEHNSLPWPDATGQISSLPPFPLSSVAGPKARDSPAPVAATQTGPASPYAPASTTVPPRLACSDCAVVESIRAVKVQQYGGLLGSVAGAIAGAILAGQAEAKRDSLRRWLGAVGGALVGHEIARQATGEELYEVVLRLPDGTALLRRYDKVPAFRPGERVSVPGISRGGAPLVTY